MIVEEYPDIFNLKESNVEVLSGLLMAAIAMLSFIPENSGNTPEEVFEKVVLLRKEIVECLNKNE